MTFELLTGASPFTIDGEKNNQQEISRRILKTEPPIPNYLNQEVRDFIARLLIKDPRRRLGGGPRDARELKEHPFFVRAPSPFSWSSLERRQITPPFVPQIAHELDTSNFSEEFTKMVAADSPAVIPPNFDKIFRGYSYVAPSVLFGDNIVSDEIFNQSIKPESNRPTASDVLAARFEESTFFQVYKLNPLETALGDGTFSVCRRCRHRQTKQEFAVKIVSRRVDCTREITLLRACQGHPNIVKLIDVYQDCAHTYIVMELLSGGELMAIPRIFTEEQASKIMKQVSSAIQFMHSRGIVHRDIKPENIVYAHTGDDSPVKLVDFGFTRQKQTCEQLLTPCFTLPYAAPEVLACQGYDESCDMWSLGAVMYSMLSGKSAFKTGSHDLATKIKIGEVNLDTDAWSRVLSTAGRAVLHGLLNADPIDRLTATGLVNNSWLAGTNINLELTKSASTSNERPGAFRLKNVEGAKLAQRRKFHKRSTSSSVSSSTSTTSSSPSSIALIRPSTSTSRTSSSPAQPNAFDFSEARVNEYLSSLSSSSDSNSPRIVIEQARDKKRLCENSVIRDNKRRKRNINTGIFKDGKTNEGPITRSKKRKLEKTNSDSSFESSDSIEKTVELKDHRKHKTGKRPGRQTAKDD